MKTRLWNHSLAAAAALCLCVALSAHGQQRGGFGGAGGFGGNRGNSASQNYPAAGQLGGASVSVDNSGNLVVIADEETLAQIKQVVREMDVPRPQVLIKVVFLEVQHNNSLDIGVEGAFGKNIGNSMTGNVANVFGVNGLNSLVTNLNPSSPASSVPALAPISGPGAGLYQILGNDFQATLRAIATTGKAQLLSRPSIIARDRQPAEIQVGQNVPLITSVNYTTFGQQNNGITYQSIGIILRVTPYITPDGMVQMIVSPETSALNQTVSVPIAQGVNAPAIDIRRADTVVVTPDGQTVVIGGLMASDKGASESKVPFLGDIPLLGNLFKRQTKTGAKTELLIFLTPHIVQAPRELAALSSKEQSRSELMKSVSERELDRFLDRVPMKEEAWPKP